MNQTRRSPGDDSRAPSKLVRQTTTTAIMTRPGDGLRARLVRHRARRELDRLLRPADPWSFAEAVEIDYHLTGLDLTLAGREDVGRDLATAGWSP